LQGNDREHWLTVLLKDAAPAIRRDALLVLFDVMEIDKCNEISRLALKDPSGRVREIARWKIEKLEIPIDLKDFYTSLLNSHFDATELATALAGLGEVGRAADVAIIIGFVESNSVRVRKAALKAIARLDGERHLDLLINALADKSPGVSKTASRALESYVTAVGTAKLWEVFNQNTEWHVKRNTLKLLNQARKWERISHLLAAAAQTDTKVREVALEYCNNWAREFASTWNYSMPKPEEITRIELAVELLSDELPAELRRLLSQCLKEWGLVK
jgi:HEAT repeat protein